MAINDKIKAVKNFFTKSGKRNLIIACAVLLIGGAVALNYFLFTDGDKVDYDGSGMTDANPDDTAGGSTVDAYFASAELSRD